MTADKRFWQDRDKRRGAALSVLFHLLALLLFAVLVARPDAEPLENYIVIDIGTPALSDEVTDAPTVDAPAPVAQVPEVEGVETGEPQPLAEEAEALQPDPLDQEAAAAALEEAAQDETEPVTEEEPAEPDELVEADPEEAVAEAEPEAEPEQLTEEVADPEELAQPDEAVAEAEPEAEPEPLTEEVADPDELVQPDEAVAAAEPEPAEVEPGEPLEEVLSDPEEALDVTAEEQFEPAEELAEDERVEPDAAAQIDPAPDVAPPTPEAVVPEAPPTATPAALPELDAPASAVLPEIEEVELEPRPMEQRILIPEPTPAVETPAARLITPEPSVELAAERSIPQPDIEAAVAIERAIPQPMVETVAEAERAIPRPAVETTVQAARPVPQPQVESTVAAEREIPRPMVETAIAGERTVPRPQAEATVQEPRPIPRPAVDAVATAERTLPRPEVAAAVTAEQAIPRPQIEAAATAEQPIPRPAVDAATAAAQAVPRPDVQATAAEARPVPRPSVEAAAAPGQAVPAPQVEATVAGSGPVPRPSPGVSVAPPTTVRVTPGIEVGDTRGIPTPEVTAVATVREATAEADRPADPGGAERTAVTEVEGGEQTRGPPGGSADQAGQTRVDEDADTEALGMAAGPDGDEEPTGAPAARTPEPFADQRFRPLAVLLDNAAGYPQMGLQEASVVFEMPVEAGMTRLMAVYDRVDPSSVGPIRSARDYFVQAARNMDGILVHDGGAPSAMAAIQRYEAPTINSFTSGELFARDANRNAPYNLYSSGSSLRQAVVRLDLNRVSTVRGQVFRPPEDLDEATRVAVRYSGTYTSGFEYIQELTLYHWQRNGDDAVDRTGESVLVSAVVVARIGAQPIPGDPEGRLYIPLEGGEATLFVRGRAIEGRWIEDGGLRFVTEEGNPIDLRAFKHWVIFAPNNAAVTIE